VSDGGLDPPTEKGDLSVVEAYLRSKFAADAKSWSAIPAVTEHSFFGDHL